METKFLSSILGFYVLVLRPGYAFFAMAKLKLKLSSEAYELSAVFVKEPLAKLVGQEKPNPFNQYSRSWVGMVKTIIHCSPLIYVCIQNIFIHFFLVFLGTKT